MQPRSKVQVWIFAWDRVGQCHFLMLKTLPDRGSFWQPVTGGVEPGESLGAAAEREALEESGFSGKLQSLDHSFHYEKNGIDFTETAFALECASLETLPPPRLDPHEHVEARWVSAKTAAEMMEFPSNQEVLEVLLEYLKKRGNKKEKKR